MTRYFSNSFSACSRAISAVICPASRRISMSSAIKIRSRCFAQSSIVIGICRLARQISGIPLCCYVSSCWCPCFIPQVNISGSIAVSHPYSNNISAFPSIAKAEPRELLLLLFFESAVSWPERLSEKQILKNASHWMSYAAKVNEKEKTPEGCRMFGFTQIPKA